MSQAPGNDADLVDIPSAVAWVFESLESKWPSSVDKDSVLVTGEQSGDPMSRFRGDVAVVLIPHRQLGGFALGVVAYSRGIEFFWERITDLATHDQLDLAHISAHLGWNQDWRSLVREQLFADLERSIQVVVERRLIRRGVYCSMTVGGSLRKTFIGWPSAGYEGGETTSLTANKPVSVSFPVPIENWRRWA